MGAISINIFNKNIDLKKKSDVISFVKSFAFGLLFSISWTPCVGVFLSSALMLIMEKQDLLKGVSLILAYSLGLGIPFIISAILVDNLKGTFSAIKKHYSVIEKISGVVLIIIGCYMLCNGIYGSVAQNEFKEMKYTSNQSNQTEPTPIVQKYGVVNEVDESNFEEEVINSTSPVFIEFYADWCGPCKMVSPIVEEIASEYSDIKFVKVNVDNCPNLSDKYQIVYIPTLIFMKNGEVVGKLVGYSNKEKIEDFIK